MTTQNIMNNIILTNKVYTSASNIPNIGRGVFSKDIIKKGEMIEEAPFLEIPRDDISLLDESFLTHYYFFFGCNKERVALALGYGSLYNHSENPNAFFKIKAKEKAIEFKALRNIKGDEEVYVNYRGMDLRVKRPLWFEI